LGRNCKVGPGFTPEPPARYPEGLAGITDEPHHSDYEYLQRMDL